MDNRTIAQRLTGFAHYLESRKRNLFRVQAYRRAAETVLGLDQPVESIVAHEGEKGLANLPGIGRHLAFTIAHLVQTGNFRILRKLPKPARTEEKEKPVAGAPEFIFFNDEVDRQPFTPPLPATPAASSPGTPGNGRG